MLEESLVLNSQIVNALPRESKYSKNYLFESQLPRVLTQRIPPFRALHLALHKRGQRKTSREAEHTEQCTDNKSIPEKEADIHALWGGIEFITENLWPLMFWSMLSYDVFKYKHFNNRYEVSLTDLMMGLPRNYDYHHASLSINLGSDIPGFWNFWPWAGMVSGAVLSGFIFRYMSRPDDSLLVDEVDEKQDRSHFEKIWQDLILVLPYVTSEYWMFQRRKRHLLQTDKHKEQKNYHEQKQRLFEEYDEESKKFPILAAALQLIKDLNLDHIVGISLIRILILASRRNYFAWKLGVDALTEIALYRKDRIGKFALSTLVAFSSKNFYVHYKLWSIGQSKNSFDHLLGYFIVAPVQLYTKYRWWALIITKIILLTRFLKDQKNCHDENKIWHFISEVGNYDCTVCDWDFVDYRRSKEGQLCVDALLSSPRSAQQILESLSVVRAHGPFTRMDFSQQSWTAWLISDWKQILHLLNNTAFDDLITFNLSRSMPETLGVTPDFLTALSDFLQFSQLRHLDVSRQIISTQGIMALSPGLRNNSRIFGLYFTESNLNDATFLQFITLTPGLSSLNTLGFSGNQLSGFALQSLSNFSNPNLTYLDLSHNFLQTADINQFSWNSTSLRILNISSADLRTGSLNEFGARLINSSLTTLVMNACGISNPLAAALFIDIAQSSIHTLSWASNSIGYQGMQTIADNLVFSGITDFDLNDNDQDDLSLNLLAISLALNITLTRLSLAGNSFTAAGFGALISSLTNSQLRGLTVSRIGLGDAGVTALITAPTVNLPLMQLDMSATSLTSEGASALFYYSANSSLIDLDVSHNLLVGDISAPLQAILYHTRLKRLNLADTFLRSENLQSAWPILPYSSLEFLDVSGNNLDDTCAISLVPYLISPVPNSDRELNSMEEDLDYNRAITCATPMTHLQELIWQSDMLTEQGAYALCLGAPSAGINTTDLILSGQYLTAGASRINGCPILMSHDQTSAAIPTTVISWLLITSLNGLTMGPHLSKYPWRLLTICMGATLASPLGFPGMAVGAILGYKIKDISTGILKELNLFVNRRFHHTSVVSSKSDEKSFWNYSR